ncbi:MAG TPA: hypothetical protein VG870_12000 [Chitinophagaceae bacterium]|nr:hypothetical protein [Chitinophagaceae bacterium]
MQATPRSYETPQVNSRLSLRPLATLLEESLSTGKPGVRRLYQDLLEELRAAPGLLEPQQDTRLLRKNSELVERLLTLLFAAGAPRHDELHAVCFPFRFDLVYASNAFEKLFVRPGTNQLLLPQEWLTGLLARERLRFAYQLLLEKQFGFVAPDAAPLVFPFPDPLTGLTRYFELAVDPRFMELRLERPLSIRLPDLLDPATGLPLPVAQLLAILPPDDFGFEGFSVLRVRDITSREIISRIKTDLLDIQDFGDSPVYQKLHSRMQGLLGMKEVRIGITPLLRLNNRYVPAGPLDALSFILRHLLEPAGRERVTTRLQDLFGPSPAPRVISQLTPGVLAQQDLEDLSVYYDLGIRSLILCPLAAGGNLVGILELVSDEPGRLGYGEVSRIEPALPLFARALEKSAEGLVHQVNRFIKEQFTAVQPAVEWKFTQNALEQVLATHSGRSTYAVQPGGIRFQQVYPLYGAIDIRNSSGERARAIQADLSHQLTWALGLLRRAQSGLPATLLEDLTFKAAGYLAAASSVLLPDEESQIREFLQGPVAGTLLHLQQTLPGMAGEIVNYFASLESDSGLVYRHRKELEDSIAAINQTLARFIDQEQRAAQQAYPHYFERFVTDGVEFNIYIGQSIAPGRPFDELYLRYMRIWQLGLLARCAQLTGALERELPLALQTTQLLLAHHNPLTICFRSAERKFDVDGAHSMRYEILKKRIDKALLKNSRERLTQPGRIAIVYSQTREADEYQEHIAFLQDRGLLGPSVESCELEPLPGVSGLRALRVDVMPAEDPVAGSPAPSLSRLTVEQLLAGR